MKDLVSRIGKSCQLTKIQLLHLSNIRSKCGKPGEIWYIERQAFKQIQKAGHLILPAHFLTAVMTIRDVFSSRMSMSGLHVLWSPVYCREWIGFSVRLLMGQLVVGYILTDTCNDSKSQTKERGLDSFQVVLCA